LARQIMSQIEPLRIESEAAKIDPLHAKVYSKMEKQEDLELNRIRGMDKVNAQSKAAMNGMLTNVLNKRKHDIWNKNIKIGTVDGIANNLYSWKMYFINNSRPIFTYFLNWSKFFFVCNKNQSNKKKIEKKTLLDSKNLEKNQTAATATILFKKNNKIPYFKNGVSFSPLPLFVYTKN